jgi:hypothetical protein
VFFWFDVPMAYDPCLCNHRAQLDVSFNFVQTADIDITGSIQGSIKTETKGSQPYAKMVFDRVLAAGMATATAIATGGAVINVSAFTDLVDIAIDAPGTSEENRKKLRMIKGYMNCSGKFISVVQGNFKGLNSKDSIKQIQSAYKILDASGNFVSALAAGCNNKDNAATIITGSIKASGTVTFDDEIEGTRISMAMPGSKWNDKDLQGSSYSENSGKVIPAYPTYNERLGTFALLETPKIDLTYLHETSYKENPFPEIMLTGKTVARFKITDDLKYTFNPKMNVDLSRTKVYCRLVINNTNGINSDNGDSFHVDAFHPFFGNGTNCPSIKNIFNFENKYFESIENSQFVVNSPFVEIDRFQKMPQIVSLNINDPHKIAHFGAVIQENIRIQFKIIFTSTEIGTKGVGSPFFRTIQN